MSFLAQIVAKKAYQMLIIAINTRLGFLLNISSDGQVPNEFSGYQIA